MTDLVNAIESLKSRDLFDYISVLLPLALSIFAIIVAVDTSKRQNKIALFEKKYSNYSELLGLCTIWKMFIDQYIRLRSENKKIPNITICSLCLTISLLGLYENEENINVTDYVKDHKIDRDKIESLLLKLRYKHSMTLEIAALLYGGDLKRIETFAKQYMQFIDRVAKVLSEKITQDEFQEGLDTFKENLSTFYKFVFTCIKPKIKLLD